MVRFEFNDAGAHQLVCLEGTCSIEMGKNRFVRYESISWLECVHGSFIGLSQYYTASDGVEVLKVQYLTDVEGLDGSKRENKEVVLDRATSWSDWR